MKISIWWLLAVPVLIAGIAHSEAAFRVVWDYEMKTPEAQKAVALYVQNRCQLTVLAEHDKPITFDVLENHTKLFCQWDEHQK